MNRSAYILPGKAALQQMGRQPDAGGLRAALHGRSVPAAGRPGRSANTAHRRHRLPRLRGDRGGDHAGLWLLEQRRGDRRGGGADVRRRLAHRLSCRPAGLDIDLLTRGAGFGYLGSTITSLIYASFTFLLFSVEASIMAVALSAMFHMPMSLRCILQLADRHSDRALRHRAPSRASSSSPSRSGCCSSSRRSATSSGSAEPALDRWSSSAGQFGRSGWQRQPALFRPALLHAPVTPAADRRAGGLSALPAERGRASAVRAGGRRWLRAARAGRCIGGVKLLLGSFLAVLCDAARRRRAGSGQPDAICSLSIFTSMTRSFRRSR